MNATQIIKRLGGIGPLAKATSVPKNSVVYWERRQRIPAKHWPHLLDLAAEIGASDITADVLMRHHCHRQPPASTAEAAA